MSLGIRLFLRELFAIFRFLLEETSIKDLVFYEYACSCKLYVRGLTHPFPLAS
jgi:hypothetical protein